MLSVDVGETPDNHLLTICHYLTKESNKQTKNNKTIERTNNKANKQTKKETNKDKENLSKLVVRGHPLLTRTHTKETNKERQRKLENFSILMHRHGFF